MQNYDLEMMAQQVACVSAKLAPATGAKAIDVTDMQMHIGSLEARLASHQRALASQCEQRQKLESQLAERKQSELAAEIGAVDEKRFLSAANRNLTNIVTEHRARLIEMTNLKDDLAAKLEKAELEAQKLKEDKELLEIALAAATQQVRDLKAKQDGVALRAMEHWAASPGKQIARAIGNHDRASTHMGLPLHDRH